MPFYFENTKIPGVILIKPKIFGDERGFFLEIYKKDEFEKAGIYDSFIQDNHSKSKKGVIRGIHFQSGEYAQSKLIRCIKGSLWDVAVDLRKTSPTFGKYFNVELSDKNKYMLYIPKGCGHGFAALTEEVEMEYKNDNLYSPENESGIIWNDPIINIEWPFKDPILSEKDKKLKTFNDLF